MLPSHVRSKTSVVWQRFLLVILAVLCVTTILESQPEIEKAFHGHDYYTISGLRSATEVFRNGGTYILHDYSVQAPGCDRCSSIEIQAEFGPPDGSHIPDFFNRIFPGNMVVVQWQSVSDPPAMARHLDLPGQNLSPETPPPRVILTV